MKNLLLIILCLLSLSLSAQVGVNTTTPEGILDIGNSTSGIVYPVVSLTDLTSETITNPNGGSIVAGTTIYNTNTVDSGANSIYPGIYFWNGSRWKAQYEKRNNRNFVQTSDLRTGSDDSTYGVSGDQTIDFDTSSFTPSLSGTFKILVTVHYGGGEANVPSGANQYVNFVEQQGEFDFTFNGTTHTFGLSSFSGYNNDSMAVSSPEIITNEFNQVTYTVVESLTALTSYNFSLTFNQEFAEGFEADGDQSAPDDGRGYITINDSVRCTVEFLFIGE